MKISFTVIVVLVVSSLVLSGCGGGSPVVSTSTTGSSSGSSGGSSGGSTSSESVTLTGTISTGGTTALPDGYVITATDVATGKTTKATVTSGKYSLTLDTQKTYVFVILDNNNREVAVVTGSDVQTLLGEKFVVSGFKMASASSSGNITVNSTNGSAFWGGTLSSSLGLVPVDKYIARASSSGTALATGGSSGNFGGGSSTTATTATASLEGDRDADGFPDMFDADANGNGTVDSQESSRLTTKLLGSTRVETASIFAASYEDGSSSAVLRVFPKSTAVSKIKSIKVVPAESPSYVQTAVALASTDDVSDSSFPSGGLGTTTTWKSLDYVLYKRSQLDTADSWAITIQSSTTAKIGDVFTIEIAYNDGTTSDKITTIVDFVMAQSATLSALNTKTPSTLGSGTESSPYVLDSDTVTFGWKRPTDSTGNKAFGMRYKISVTYYDASNKKIGIEEYPEDSQGDFTPVLDADASQDLSATISLKTSMKQGASETAVAKRKTVSIHPVDLLSTGRSINEFEITTPVDSSSSSGSTSGLKAIKSGSASGTAATGSGTESSPYVVNATTSTTANVYLEWSHYNNQKSQTYTVSAIYVGGKIDKASGSSGVSGGSGSNASGTVTFKKTFDGAALQKFDIIVFGDSSKSVVKNVYIQIQ